MKKALPPDHVAEPAKGEILLYQVAEHGLRLEVRLQDESVWLSQAQMAELFQRDRSVITKHINNAISEGEIDGKSNVQFLHIASSDKPVAFYNLDVIISVGYRVKSLRGTQFRRWATGVLREYLVKGFALDDKRLKEPGSDRYFEELLARIRDIRSSEKIFWRKVLDIYATSVDYDPKSTLSQNFFKQVQNQMHWAAHGHTAAELIFHRANAELPQMGVTTFPGDKLLKRDVEVAKNFLSATELDMLNRIVSAYLEVAEIQAMNRNPLTMHDWIERLHQFLTMTGRDLLLHAGTVSHEAALRKAHNEYEKYRAKQLAEPTAVEKHFVEAEQELKKLEAAKKSSSEGGKKQARYKR